MTQQVNGTFVRFDAQTRMLVVNDAIGAPVEFALRDDTAIDAGDRTDDYLELHPGATPWTAGQALMITWRPSADKKKRVAVSVR